MKSSFDKYIGILVSIYLLIVISFFIISEKNLISEIRVFNDVLWGSTNPNISILDGNLRSNSQVNFQSISKQQNSKNNRHQQKQNIRNTIIISNSAPTNISVFITQQPIIATETNYQNENKNTIRSGIIPMLSFVKNDNKSLELNPKSDGVSFFASNRQPFHTSETLSSNNTMFRAGADVDPDPEDPEGNALPLKNGNWVFVVLAAIYAFLIHYRKKSTV